jgi:hypothetical protein
MARDAVEDAKENLEATRENIDSLMNILTERRARIDKILENNAQTMEKAVVRQEEIEQAALHLIRHVQGEPILPDVIENAARQIKPYSFFLSNYANVEEMDINIDEINSLLSEGRLDYELGELTH